MTYRRPRLKH
ncbi:unnamed protein product, partial [Didymodactylos carnosus]